MRAATWAVFPTLLALVLALAVHPAAAAEEVRVAVVDFRRALTETEEGRQATADLKRLLETRQKELQASEAALKKSIEDLDRKRTLLPAESVRKQENELQGKVQALRQTFERHQNELGRKQAEVMERLQTRLQRIVSTIATTERLTLVLDRSPPGPVVFARPHLDITNELIRRFNAGEARPAGTAPPRR
jgi:outer membrane protein